MHFIKLGRAYLNLDNVVSVAVIDDNVWISGTPNPEEGTPYTLDEKMSALLTYLTTHSTDALAGYRPAQPTPDPTPEEIEADLSQHGW